MNVNRGIWLGVAALAALLIGICVYFAPQLDLDSARATVGFVNVQKVFEGSTRGRAQIKTFQKELATRSDEVKKMGEEAEALRQEIQVLVKQGNNAEAQRKLPAFQEAQKKLMEVQQQASQDLQQTQAEVDKAFMEQLKVVLNDIRRHEKLQSIQALDPNKVLSYDETLDLTHKALERYNHLYPAASD